MSMNIVEFVASQESFFIPALSDDRIKWEKESQFAIQAFQANKYLAGIAQSNPTSAQNAIINVAAIGVSLNPQAKLAYLVPRKGAVCLDISYMGMLHIAQQSGSILWGQAKIVRENDHYSSNGIDKAPDHKFNTFAPMEQRGKIVGAYCVVKTADGSFLTEEMNLEQIYSVRDRSDAWVAYVKDNSKKCPWVTDEEEMMRKTLVKRGYKYWPKSQRLDAAIDLLNTEGEEGISFNHKNQANPVDVTPVSIDVVAMILDIIEAKGRNTEKFCEYLSGKFKRQIKMISELTSTEAAWAIKALEQVK